MNAKKKNTTNEPSEVYETAAKENVDKLHPVLVQLIEKSKKNHKEGTIISHEEAMLKIKERYPFLK